MATFDLPIVDARKFGARGDLSADDTISIQRALNSVSGTGGKVVLPKGQYPVSDSLRMFSNVILEGEGPLSKLIATGSNYFRILTGTSINNFGIRDLALIGKRPNTSSPSIWLASTAYTVGQYVSANSNVYLCITGGTSTTGTGPSTTGSNITDGTAHWSYVGVLWQPNDDATFFTDCTLVRLQDLTCYNFWNDGIIFELSTGAIIEGCSVNNCNKDGIYLSACESSTISNNIVTHTYIGFAIANTWYSTINSNTSYSNAAVDIAVGRDSRYNTVNGNSTEYIALNQESTIGTTHGVPHAGSLYDYTYGGHRNVISDNRTKRINAFYSNENTITNNIIENGPEIGIYLAGSKRNQVQGNRIYNCANTGAVGNSSILLNTFSPGGVLDPTGVTCDDNLILDNHCIDDRAVPLMYGLQLVAGSTGNVVRGNWVSGVAGTPKILDSGTNNLVENNRVSSGYVRQSTFNVKQFGAVGDGVTDDRAAIQNAINQAVSLGGTLLFPVATYYVTGAPNVGSSTLLVSGAAGIEIDGNNSTIKQGPGSARVLLIYNSQNIKIKNFRFIGYTGLLDPTTENFALGAISNNSSGITFENCYFTNCLGDCIYIGGDIANGATTGAQTKQITINNCILKTRYGNGVPSFQTGSMSRMAIAVTDCDGLTITNNKIYGTSDFEPNVNRQGVRRVIFSNNICDAGPVRPQAVIGSSYNFDELIIDNGGLSSPTVAPTVTITGSGGSIPSGNYYAVYTYVNAFGETPRSPHSSVISVTSANSSITVSGGAIPAGASGVKIYLSSSHNSFGKEVYSTTYSSGSDTVITALPSSGAEWPPIELTTNVAFTGVAGISDTINNIVQGNIIGNGTLSAANVYESDFIDNYLIRGHIAIGADTGGGSSAMRVVGNKIRGLISGYATGIMVRNFSTSLFQNNELTYAPGAYMFGILTPAGRSTFMNNIFADDTGAGMFTGTSLNANDINIGNILTSTVSQVTISNVVQGTSLSALPAASSSYRGGVATLLGGSGVQDKIYVCKKLANETYDWVEI